MSSLGVALRAGGFDVVDTPVYGRSTTWKKVEWLMVHHTAGSDRASSEAAQMQYLKTAPAERYPPLAQLGLGQSGRVYVISKQRPGQAEPGRASHAGYGSYPGIPTNGGNQVALGIECHCSGAHTLSTHKTMYEELIKLLVFLCKRYGLSENRVIGHREYSSTGKIDPRDNMTFIRMRVKQGLAATPEPEEDEDMPVIIKNEETGELAVYNGVFKWRIGSNTPNYVHRCWPGIRTVNQPKWFFDGVPDARETSVNSYLAATRSDWLVNTFAPDVARRVWGYKNPELESRDTYQILRDIDDKEAGGLPEHTHEPGGVQ